MPYSDLLRKGRIRPLLLTPEERARRIGELLSVAERELQDAGLYGRSADGQHNSAYAAARAVAEAIMTAEGYRRGSGEGQHAIIFEFLRLVDDGRFATEADYFDHARRVRNETEYERAGVVSYSLAEATAKAAQEFMDEVRAWLQESDEGTKTEGTEE